MKFSNIIFIIFILIIGIVDIKNDKFKINYFDKKIMNKVATFLGRVFILLTIYFTIELIFF